MAHFSESWSPLQAGRIATHADGQEVISGRGNEQRPSGWWSMLRSSEEPEWLERRDGQESRKEKSGP